MSLSAQLQSQRQAKREEKRRRLQERKPRMVLDNRVGAMVFTTTLFRANVQATSEEDVALLAAPAYAAIDALKLGRMDDEQFIRANEMNITGFTLGKRLHQFAANEDTKAMIRPSQEAFEHAAEALAAIGTRKNEIGHYTAKAGELELLGAAYEWLEQLIRVSDKGHVATAIREAKVLVRSKL